MGGMGISNPVTEADSEFEYSTIACSTLQNKMLEAQRNFHIVSGDVTHTTEKDAIGEIRRRKAAKLKERYDKIYIDCVDGSNLESDLQRSLLLAQEKGSSSWLTTIPVASLSFALTKQEFCDAISMRYNWKIRGVPKHCACGKLNDIDHALSCPNGGYVILRHNQLRDYEASLLEQACDDVKVEPPLIPLSGQQFSASTLHEDEARPDICCRSFWSRLDKTFFDIMVTHLNVLSNRTKTPESVYASKEAEKKRKYQQRILDVEKATFVPLVFSTSGGQAPECDKYHQRLAVLLSQKRNEDYSDVIRTIRQQVRFCLLRTTLMAIRGFRTPKKRFTVDLGELDFYAVQTGESDAA